MFRHADPSMDELDRAIEREPLEPALHRALFEAVMRRRQFDRAYCVAATLVHLGGANREQAALFRQLRPRGLPTFKARLGAAAWLRDLGHSDLDRAVGGVFEVLARAARTTKATRPRGTREEPSSTQSLAAKAYFGAANVLGLQRPELYLRPEQVDPIVTLATETPASMVGAPLLSGWSVPELMFVFGKHLVTHQGEHAVRTAFPMIRELSTLLSAGIELVRPRPDPPAHVARLRDGLRRALTTDELARLRPATATLASLAYEGDLETHVTRWLHGSQRTGVRAGLLLCGDPAIASRLLHHETAVAGDLSTSEKQEEMVRFAVSGAHHSLRRSLGIAVDVVTEDTRAASKAESKIDEDDEPTRDRALCA